MYPAKKENMLLILHELQRRSAKNFLSKEDIVFVSSYLGVTCGVVYGVATYYGMFSLVPRGKYLIKVCKSPVCHMLGAISLINYLCVLLKIREGQTTSDDLFTLEATECLGQCDKAPCMFVNDKLYGNLTKRTIEKILIGYKKR